MSDIVLSRRGLIRGFAGLAALSVIPGTAKALLRRDQDEIVYLLRTTGRLEWRSFLVSDTITLVDMKGIIIRNCTFTTDSDFPPGHPIMLMGRGCENNLITHCSMRGAAPLPKYQPSGSMLTFVS